MRLTTENLETVNSTLESEWFPALRYAISLGYEPQRVGAVMQGPHMDDWIYMVGEEAHGYYNQNLNQKLLLPPMSEQLFTTWDVLHQKIPQLANFPESWRERFPEWEVKFTPPTLEEANERNRTRPRSMYCLAMEIEDPDGWYRIEKCLRVVCRPDEVSRNDKEVTYTQKRIYIPCNGSWEPLCIIDQEETKFLPIKLYEPDYAAMVVAAAAGESAANAADSAFSWAD